MQDDRSRALHLLTYEADTFIETLRALKKLFELVHPQARTLDETPGWAIALRSQLEHVPREKRERFTATMVEAYPFVVATLLGTAHAYRDLGGVELSSKTWHESDPKTLLPEDVQSQLSDAQEQESSEASSASAFTMLTADDGEIRLEFDDPELEWHFWRTVSEVQKHASTPSHTALLMRSTLIMAVSAFEVFVASLFRAHLICNPGAATEAGGQKEFSLQDLFDFGSVEDAIDESIHRRADAFSRKGVRAWAEWFKGKPLSIDFTSLALDWHATEEVFERRNVVVHNGSRITRQYLHNVHRSLTVNMAEGMPLEVTPEYVNTTLTRLTTLAMLLAVNARLRLFKKADQSEASTWIANQQFELLSGEQWGAVEHIAIRTASLDLTQVALMQIKVNGWIARTHLHGTQSCIEDVASWDTSALGKNYRAARLVLLREDESAVQALRECIAENSFSMKDIAEWPLFHWMREDGALDELMREGMDSSREDSEEEGDNQEDFEHPVATT